MIILFLLLLTMMQHLVQSASARPHIIFILTDDLGWNDVSFHGSTQIATPNIDNLCYGGTILNNYYSLPVCTASRAALLTSRYPIRYGFQSQVLLPCEPRCLPLNETILPQYLKQLGYQTAMVGKWHLGFAANACLPHHRGFDRFFGFYGSDNDLWDRSLNDGGFFGFDIASNSGHPDDTFGIFATDLWYQQTINMLEQSDPNKPLFLYIAEQTAHTGEAWHPMSAPARHFTNSVNKIDDLSRRTYAAMVTALDEAVGKLVTALKRLGFYDNAIVVFLSDNGGTVNGFQDSAGSNFPLRGGKMTLFEGGVRVTACIHSRSHLPDSVVGTASNQMMHVVDWLPTLLTAAGASPHLYSSTPIDGVNMWRSLTSGTGQPRGEMLLNHDPVWKQSAVRVGDYKLLVGPSMRTKYGGWYLPMSAAYSDYSFWNDSVNVTILRMDNVHTNYQPVKVQCGSPVPVACDQRSGPCLFNVVNDPCELVNLAGAEPAKLNELQATLQNYIAQAAPPGNLPLTAAADPQYHNGFLQPYLTTDQLLQGMYPDTNRTRNASVCTAACTSQLNRCSGIPLVENALHNGTSANENALVTYLCRRGFRLRGAATIVCSSSGQWKPAIPTCWFSQLK